jgi:hypothetical protein
MKSICDKTIAFIILNGEKLKFFPLNSGTIQKCPLSLLSTRTLRQSNKARERNKSHSNREEKCKIMPI